MDWAPLSLDCERWPDLTVDDASWIWIPRELSGCTEIEDDDGPVTACTVEEDGWVCEFGIRDARLLWRTCSNDFATQICALEGPGEHEVYRCVLDLEGIACTETYDLLGRLLDAHCTCE